MSSNILIIPQNKKVEEYIEELWSNDPCGKLKRKNIINKVKSNFGSNAIIVRRATPQEMVDKYQKLKNWNIEVNAPNLILEDFDKKLAYWKKRLEKTLRK